MLGTWATPAMKRPDTAQTPGSRAGVPSHTFQTPIAEPNCSGHLPRVRHDPLAWVGSVSTPPHLRVRVPLHGRTPLAERSSAGQNANQGRGRETVVEPLSRLTTPSGVTRLLHRGPDLPLSCRATQSPALSVSGLRAGPGAGPAIAHLSADWCCPSGSPDGAVVEGYERLRDVLDAVMGKHFAFSFCDYAADFDGRELQEQLVLLSEPAWGLDAQCTRAIAAEYERRRGPRVRLDGMLNEREDGAELVKTPRALTRASPLVRGAGAYNVFDADYCSVCSSECTRCGGSPRRPAAPDVFEAADGSRAHASAPYVEAAHRSRAVLSADVEALKRKVAELARPGAGRPGEWKQA